MRPCRNEYFAFSIFCSGDHWSPVVVPPLQRYLPDTRTPTHTISQEISAVFVDMTETVGDAEDGIPEHHKKAIAPLEMRCYGLWAPLKTPSEKKQLCTAYAVSSPLGVRKHAFKGFPCICCTYLFFLTENGFLEMPLSLCFFFFYPENHTQYP